MSGILNRLAHDGGVTCDAMWQLLSRGAGAPANRLLLCMVQQVSETCPTCNTSGATCGGICDAVRRLMEGKVMFRPRGKGYWMVQRPGCKPWVAVACCKDMLVGSFFHFVLFSSDLIRFVSWGPTPDAFPIGACVIDDDNNN